MSTVHGPAVTVKHYAKAREIALVAVAGTGAFVLSLLLGRGMRLLGALPMFLPSLVVALPRCYVLLSLRSRVRSFGALTAAGIVEAICLFGFGSISPLALIVPALSALCADVLWTRLAAVESRTAAAISGGVLAATRVACAILLWAIVWWPRSGGVSMPPVQVLALVVCGNFILGAIAGVAVARIWKKSERSRGVK